MKVPSVARSRHHEGFPVAGDEHRFLRDSCQPGRRLAGKTRSLLSQKAVFITSHGNCLYIRHLTVLVPVEIEE